jgi:hypothetical protein
VTGLRTQIEALDEIAHHRMMFGIQIRRALENRDLMAAGFDRGVKSGGQGEPRAPWASGVNDDWRVECT